MACLCMMIYTVRIGQDPAIRDDKAAACAAELPFPLPWQGVVGF